MADFDPKGVDAHEHESWEAAAGSYAETTAFATALSGQLEIAVELGAITASSTVLDVGCGPGQLTAALSKIADAVFGVDFSEHMISEARKSYPNIDFHVANAERLPFDDGSFDVVVCCYVANHFARPVTAFRDQHRTLKPGGRLVVISPIQHEQVSMGVLLQALSESLPKQDEKVFPSGPLAQVSDPQSYIDVLQEAGFEKAKCESRTKPLVQPNLERMCSALWQLAGLANQPSNVQQGIRTRIEELANAYRDDDGAYSFPDKVMACAAYR